MSTARRAKLALIAVLIVAAWLRFSHLDWDSLLNTHPDERGILFVASSMRLPARPLDLLSPARSPMNPLRNVPPQGGPGEPRPFAYGHLPLYAMLAARALLSPVLGAAHPDPFVQLTLVGRGLSALYDTLTVALAGLLARRLYGQRAGWLAAAFTALAVLHIQQAHFATVDTALALLALASLWFMSRIAGSQPPTTRDSLLAGLCAGLALSAKASALALALPLVVAHMRPKTLHYRLTGQLWLALAGTGLAFALTSPYALLDLPLYAGSIGTQAAMVSGRLDVAFTRQYAGTLPLWYGIVQQARWGLGLPLTVACYAGLFRATWHLRARRAASIPSLPLVVWAWAILLTTGVPFVKFPRYMLPITPVLFVFAAGLLADRPGADDIEGAQARRTVQVRLRAVLTVVVLLATALNALAFSRLYDEPHPWLQASLWLYDTLPPGAVMAVERGDDALPLDLDGEGEPLRAALVYDQRALDPYAADEDLAPLVDDLAASDIVALASNRLYGTIPRLADEYPVAASLYRHLFAGELGFVLERAFTRYPDLFGLALVDDTFTRPGLSMPADLAARLPSPRWTLGYADESLTVYDRPLVLIFRNQAHLSRDELRRIIRAGAGDYR